MPRIETPDLPEDRTTLDLCGTCYDFLAPEAEEEGWEIEPAHPPYEDTDYTCDECGVALGEKDNL